MFDPIMLRACWMSVQEEILFWYRGGQKQTRTMLVPVLMVGLVCVFMVLWSGCQYFWARFLVGSCALWGVTMLSLVGPAWGFVLALGAGFLSWWYHQASLVALLYFLTCAGAPLALGLWYRMKRISRHHQTPPVGPSPALSARQPFWKMVFLVTNISTWIGLHIPEYDGWPDTGALALFKGVLPGLGALLMATVWCLCLSVWTRGKAMGVRPQTMVYRTDDGDYWWLFIALGLWVFWPHMASVNMILLSLVPFAFEGVSRYTQRWGEKNPFATTFLGVVAIFSVFFLGFVILYVLFSPWLHAKEARKNGHD